VSARWHGSNHHPPCPGGWQASCDHLHGTPWRTCDTEADCISLRKESEPRWGDA
jgi:hypothetical protein